MQPEIPRGLTVAEQVEQETARVVAGEQGCGYTCPGCHGGHQCLRAQHDDDQPHIGRDQAGQLVQWHGTCDDDRHAAAQAQAVEDRATHTRNFLAGLDPDILRDFLRDLLNGATP